MDCKVKRPRRWTRPKPGSKGAVHFRYASLASISSATARDHFRTRTYAELPHLTAKMLRAAFAEQNYHAAGKTLQHHRRQPQAVVAVSVPSADRHGEGDHRPRGAGPMTPTDLRFSWMLWLLVGLLIGYRYHVLKVRDIEARRIKRMALECVYWRAPVKEVTGSNVGELPADVVAFANTKKMLEAIEAEEPWTEEQAAQWWKKHTERETDK